MKHSTLLYAVCLTALSLILSACGRQQAPANTAEPITGMSVLDYVDPFIGTAGDHGQLHPAATLPFGMIQMGAETPGRSHSGYDFNAAQLSGFSHNRSSGVGCRGSGGNLLVRADYNRPAQGPVVLHKPSEQASPGYYAVSYGEDNIHAEMTSAPASGWQRYHFPKQGSVWLTIDVSHAHHRFYGGEYSLQDNDTISGAISAATVCDEGRYQVFFNMKINRPALEVVADSPHQLKLRYRVDADDTLVVQTGFSPVDTATAAANRIRDSRAGDFDATKRAAQQQWRDKLSKFTVAGDPEKRKLFYSHLYRVYSSPYLMAEKGESYRASDGKLYRAQANNHYFGWSLWDTFRSKFPLLTIIEAEVMEDIAASLAISYQQQKPLWATNTEPYITVRMEHAGIILLDAWRKGIRSFDPQTLLPHLAEEADNLPRQSPDQILEASYDDWAVANFATITGQRDIAASYFARAGEYRTMWKQKFLHTGPHSDVMHAEGLYEGTLWQYRWFVPFDTAWLIEQLGGGEGFSAELQYFFDKQLFNIGNQPDIQTPFMFNFAGQAWRSQRIIFQLLNERTTHWYGTHDKKDTPFIDKVFRAQPEGFIPEMDDDDGTMTAWYVFAVMGLYPAVPGVPVYTLHTPGFKHLSIRLDNGKRFAIDTSDPGKPYIQSVTLNGQALQRSWISHDEIMQGGRLVVTTASTPNKEWGRQAIFTTSLSQGTNP